MLVDVTFLAPMSATDDVKVSEETRLFVPQQVIQRNENGAFVWLADQSDKLARQIAVTAGNSATGGLVEISGEGITIASRIIARGYENLEHGDRIRIVTEDAEALPTATTTTPQHSMNRLPDERE
jgi:hypothetical protein